MTGATVEVLEIGVALALDAADTQYVRWRSADGTWSLGVFAGRSLPDPWAHVCSGHVDLAWVTVGHPTAQAARDAWDGGNFGWGGHVVDGDRQLVDTLDEAAVACRNDDGFRRRARARSRRRWGGPFRW